MAQCGERHRRAIPAAAFDLPLTRGEIAALLGLTIETVSRQLTALERDGVIRRNGARGIELVDAARLEAVRPAEDSDDRGDDRDGDRPAQDQERQQQDQHRRLAAASSWPVAVSMPVCHESATS